MTREELRIEIEILQEKVWKHFSIKKEYDYHLREEIVDAIIYKFHKAVSSPSDDEIMRASIEFSDDIREQAEFRTYVKFMRVCMRDYRTQK